jgi:hypothetical protein
MGNRSKSVNSACTRLLPFVAASCLFSCATGLDKNAGVEITASAYEVILRWTEQHPRDHALANLPAELQILDVRSRVFENLVAIRSPGTREFRFRLPAALKTMPEGNTCLTVFFGRNEPLPVRMQGQGPSNGFRYPAWDSAMRVSTQLQIKAAGADALRREVSELNLLVERLTYELSGILQANKALTCESIDVAELTAFDSRYVTLGDEILRDEAARELCVWRVERTKAEFTDQTREARREARYLSTDESREKFLTARLRALPSKAFAFDSVDNFLTSSSSLFKGRDAEQALDRMRQRAFTMARDQERLSPKVRSAEYRPLARSTIDSIRLQPESSPLVDMYAREVWFPIYYGVPLPLELRTTQIDRFRLAAAHLTVYDQCVSEVNDQIRNTVESLKRRERTEPRVKEAQRLAVVGDCQRKDAALQTAQKERARLREVLIATEFERREPNQANLVVLPSSPAALNGSACR